MAKKKAAAKKASSTKNVYFFGAGTGDGNGTQKELLGGKGANLAEMSIIGLNISSVTIIVTL